MSGLDQTLVGQMLAESARASVVATGADRIVLDRARVLAEHGVTAEEDARAFDRAVAAIGGSLRRARSHDRERLYWELPRNALNTAPVEQADEGDANAASA